ncbi:hypothetical protein [Amycolatopsis sp. NPDC051903]|uniref:hypothetical protein n=1 Tax=Amycolatopsis sp. NPDC051903 TaxID=3363936 RepID=UPI0037A21610
MRPTFLTMEGDHRRSGAFDGLHRGYQRVPAASTRTVRWSSCSAASLTTSATPAPRGPATSHREPRELLVFTRGQVAAVWAGNRLIRERQTLISCIRINAEVARHAGLAVPKDRDLHRSGLEPEVAEVLALLPTWSSSACLGWVSVAESVVSYVVADTLRSAGPASSDWSGASTLSVLTWDAGLWSWRGPRIVRTRVARDRRHGDLRPFRPSALPEGTGSWRCHDRPEVCAVETIGHVGKRRDGARASVSMHLDDQAACRFALGDMALELEPMRPQSGGNGGFYEALQVFADEIGAGFRTLDYDAVAAAWPDKHAFARAGWTVYQRMAYLPERFRSSRVRPSASG